MLARSSLSSKSCAARTVTEYGALQLPLAKVSAAGTLTSGLSLRGNTVTKPAGGGLFSRIV